MIGRSPGAVSEANPRLDARPERAALGALVMRGRLGPRSEAIAASCTRAVAG